MSDFVTTPVLGLFKPTYDADDDQWGNHLNENFDILDGVITSAAADARYLPLTGGELSGNIIITNDNAVGSDPGVSAGLTLSANTGGSNYIQGASPGLGLPWWQVSLGSSPSEGGEGGGPPADFQIARFNDAGALIDYPLTISRATGVVTFGPVPPSTMRRFGEAPAVTATAGVGTLQGHPVNGTVIQGSGSASDFLLLNKSGTTVVSVPTGSANFNVGGIVTSPAAIHTGAITGLGASQGGVGGSATHGLLLQGSGGTNDIALQNKAGTAVLVVPTGTPNANFGVGSSVGMHQLTIGQVTGLGVATPVTALGVTAFPVYTSTAPALVNFSLNPSGIVNSGQQNLINIADLDSTNTTGAGGPGGTSVLSIGWAPGAAPASMTGNRNGMQSVMTVSAKTGNTRSVMTPFNAGGAYYVAGLFKTIGQANDNGTAGNETGSLFGFNAVAVTRAGGTYFFTVIAAEFDVESAGQAPAYREGIKIVLGGNDSYRGTLHDLAFSFGQNHGGSGTLPGWAYGISFTTRLAYSPWASDSVLIGSVPDILNNSAFVADRGVDLTNFTFTTAFLKSKGFLVDGSGNTSMARAGFNGVTAIAKPTVSGAKASNAALASLIAALASYGLITDTTTA